MNHTSNEPLKKVLVAVDGSEDSGLAVRAAAGLSNRIGAELHVVHAWRDEVPPSLPNAMTGEFSEARERWEREAAEVLKEQAKLAENAGTTVDGAHLRKGRPADEIADLAEELDAGLVVVGSRGLGTVKRLVMGSVSEGVVSLAPCPVLVMRGGEGAWPPPRIIVGADLSEEARRAAELAVGLGDTLDAEVFLVMAYLRPMQVSPRGPNALAEAERADREASSAVLRFAAGLEGATGARPRRRAVLGYAASVIQDAAEEGEVPALVVVGRRGVGAVRRFVLGSVSTDVMRSVAGPVLIVPSHARA
jgi:nucleotide-binding universal stress UspA family protein